MNADLLYKKFERFSSIPDNIIFNHELQVFESNFGTGEINNYEEFIASIDVQSTNKKLQAFIVLLESLSDDHIDGEYKRLRHIAADMKAGCDAGYAEIIQLEKEKALLEKEVAELKGSLEDICERHTQRVGDE